MQKDFHNKRQKAELPPRDRTSADDQRLQVSSHQPRIFNPVIGREIQSEAWPRTCSSPSPPRHRQQQIKAEPRLHQQPQPPNLIKSEAAEEAIVFMLALACACACTGSHFHVLRRVRESK